MKQSSKTGRTTSGCSVTAILRLSLLPTVPISWTPFANTSNTMPTPSPPGVPLNAITLLLCNSVIVIVTERSSTSFTVAPSKGTQPAFSSVTLHNLNLFKSKVVKAGVASKISSAVMINTPVERFRSAAVTVGCMVSGVSVTTRFKLIGASAFRLVPMSATALPNTSSTIATLSPPGWPEIAIAFALCCSVKVTVNLVSSFVVTEAPVNTTSLAPGLPNVPVVSLSRIFVKSTNVFGKASNVSLPKNVSTPVLKFKVAFSKVGKVESCVSST